MRGDWRGEGGEFIIADVETSPVDGGGGRWESGVGVPEERGDVAQVAGWMSVRAGHIHAHELASSPNLFPVSIRVRL